MTPLFNWNVKELFLYMTAEYTTKSNVSEKYALIAEMYSYKM